MQPPTPLPPEATGDSTSAQQLPNVAEAMEWLARADQDLQAARGVLSLQRPLPAIAVYHAQQAAEKALKAYLVAANVRFRLTHNLVELTAACLPLEPGFAALEADTVLLTPYATEYRYPMPGTALEPPLSQAKTAVEAAERVLLAVRGKLQV